MIADYRAEHPTQTGVPIAALEHYAHYYPFGMQQPGRNGNRYRFGFNSQEKDDEIYGTGNSMTAEYWQYDARLGRRWNVDPLTKEASGWSPYRTFYCNPITYVDPSGLLESTHTDEDGNVIAVHDDGDNGVYKHEGKGDEAAKTVEQNYSEDNTSAGGEEMGETITWDSFLDYNTNKPAGKIDFDSYEAYEFLSKLKANVSHYKMSYGKSLAVKVYALQAGKGDKFDFKAKGNGDIYRGSRINIDRNNPVYMSARDVGNYGAGLAARMCDMDKLDYMLTAGAFQQHGNNKLALLLNLDKYKREVKQFPPSYGEHRRSNKAQRLGYEKIETSKGYKLKYNKVWSD